MKEPCTKQEKAQKREKIKRLARKEAETVRKTAKATEENESQGRKKKDGERKKIPRRNGHIYNTRVRDKNIANSNEPYRHVLSGNQAMVPDIVVCHYAVCLFLPEQEQPVGLRAELAFIIKKQRHRVIVLCVAVFLL